MLIKHCKVGTISETIRLRYRYRLTVGKIIKFQRRSYYDEWEHKWLNGRVWHINPDGLFFLELM